MKLASFENKIRKTISKEQFFATIGKIGAELHQPVFIIGGYVRDLILDRPSKDIDFVTKGQGIKVAEEVAKRLRTNQISIFKSYGTAMIKHGDLELEFVGARKESYDRNSRNPIVEDGTIEEDQLRRDFTINALAIDLSAENFGKIIDPFNGIQDIEDKVLRTPLDPDITYSDDPLRMFRAIRFACQLGFEIEKESIAAIKRNASRVDILSQERIIDEINKMILSPNPSLGFKLMLTLV